MARNTMLRAIIVCLLVVLCHAKKPHILFLVADDLGWADVSEHGSDIPTPNIDYYANQGIKLNNYYVQPLCTPSRCALLTGRYPIRYGFQTQVVIPAQPDGLNVNEVLLPEFMKSAGYVTRLVGKWHVGFARWAYTPTYRGFDSFYGYYNAQEDHFLHTVSATTYNDGSPVGYDLRRDTGVDWSASGKYGTYLFTEEVVTIIENHNQNKPLFMYYTIQNNHEPLQVPDHYLSRCEHVTNATRKTYCGMGVAMDEAVANITAALKRVNMFDDTIIMFTTDNGGMPTVGGNNWPYRGGKYTLWEGGVKGTGWVYGSSLRKGVVSNALMHITDWLPTLASLAGSTLSPPNPLDGYDMWDAIANGSPSPRSEILLNIDPVHSNAGIKVGDWKLVTGPQQYDGYFPIPNDTSVFIQAPSYSGLALFDLASDPTEMNDVSTQNPNVVATLLSKIADYEEGMVTPLLPSVDPASFPSNWGGAWTPWLG